MGHQVLQYEHPDIEQAGQAQSSVILEGFHHLGKMVTVMMSTEVLMN